VIAQKPSPELAEKIRASGLDVTDLVGCGLATDSSRAGVAAEYAGSELELQVL
jgi:hypothetical protein